MISASDVARELSEIRERMQQSTSSSLPMSMIIDNQVDFKQIDGNYLPAKLIPHLHYGQCRM